MHRSTLLWPLGLVALLSCRDAVAPEARDIEPLVSIGTAQSARLTYMCANRFRVRNTSNRTLTVKWEVWRTADSGYVKLRPKPANAPHSEEFFITRVRGTVRILVDGVLADTKANGGTACASASLDVVDLGGVDISPGVGQVGIGPGTIVSYQVRPKAGFTNAVVELDGRPVPVNGTLTLSTQHTLLASADPILPPSAMRDSFVQHFSDIVRDRQPVEAWHSLKRAETAALDVLPADSVERIMNEALGIAMRGVTDPRPFIRAESKLLGQVYWEDTSSPPIADARPAFEAPSAAEGGDRVQLVFVNGIHTGLGGYVTGRRAVKELVQERLGRAPRRVAEAYNSSMLARPGDVLSPRAMLAWCVYRDKSLGAIMGELVRASNLLTCLNPGVAYAYRYVTEFDLVEAAVQVLQLLDETQPIDDDVEKVMRVVEESRRPDSLALHTLVVAHSQGNMFVQQALGKQFIVGEPADSGACFGIASLAAPRNDRFQLHPSSLFRERRMAWDIIGLTSEIAGVPQARPEALPLADSLMTTVDPSRRFWAGPDFLSGLREMRSVDFVRKWFAARTRLHELRRTYLEYQDMRRLVSLDVLDVLNACRTERIDIAGRGSLSVGETEHLSATTVSVDQSSRARRLRWISSNPSSVAVDSLTGLVTALSPGVAEVTAKLWYGIDGLSELLGRKTVSVAASLPDTLSGQWFTIVESLTNPFGGGSAFCRARWTFSPSAVIEDRDQYACSFGYLPGFLRLTMRAEFEETTASGQGGVQLIVRLFELVTDTGERVCQHPSVPGLCYELTYTRHGGTEPLMTGTSWVLQPHVIFTASKSDGGLPWGTPWW